VAALALLSDIAAEQTINLEVFHTIRGHLTLLRQSPMGCRAEGRAAQPS
jgi:hypothetical protein